MGSCRVFLSAALVVAALGVAGCRSEPPPPPMYPPEVHIDSPDLYGKIGVGVGTRVDGEILRVQCQCTNLLNCPMNVEYKFTFIDQGGMVIPDPNPLWTPLQFGPNEMKSIDAASHGPRPSHFFVAFRWYAPIR